MNRRLWIGGSILLLLLVAAVGGSRLAPYAKDYRPGMQYIPTANGSKLVAPPLPPSLAHPFGTDKTGNDLLSAMLYGAKYTLFAALLIALLRVTVGGAIGMYLGITGKRQRKFPLMGPLNAIPVFIFVYFVIIHLNTEVVGRLNPQLSPLALTLLLGAVLTVLGIPGVASVMQERTAQLATKEFVLAARTLGAGTRRLLIKHILPSVREQVLILFLNEAILALSIIGQLGIFYVWMGGTKLFTGDIIDQVNIPYVGIPGSPQPVTFEWAGLIGAGRSYLMEQQWMIAFPLAGYVLLILSLYLVQSGLQQAVRTRAAHV